MSKIKLKLLDEHNAQASERHFLLNDNSPVLNGIACPKCGEELYDSNPNEYLTSNPPQKNVYCPKCKHRGYRIA